MRTHLEFRSTEFPPYPSEEKEVNPGLFGKRLAEFLADGLPFHGFKVIRIVAEDWGWMLGLENDVFPLWVGCGNYEEFPDGFLCFIEPSKPRIQRWFSKVETTPTVERLAASLEALLQQSGKVSGLRWWSDDEARG